MPGLSGGVLPRPTFQSAPAHMDGRCPAFTRRWLIYSAFQSAPAHMDGRCRVTRERARASASFNPLPPTWTGDARVAAALWCALHWFQSAPAHMDGRCRLRAGPSFNLSEFQSAPAHMDGRCLIWGVARTSSRACFNPLPPTWTGDAGMGKLQEKVIMVSIRSRPHGREMPHALVLGQRRITVSIRSRPHGREMPLVAMAFQSRVLVFQSAPAHMDGRCIWARMGPANAHPGFNPLPPTWTGDAPARAEFERVCAEFQSAPAHMDGRCRRDFHAIAKKFASFNPLPPTWTGDAASSGLISVLSPVSIRSRPHGREMLRYAALAEYERVFQSAPAHMDGRCSPAPRQSTHTVCVSIRSRPHGREMPITAPN